MDSYKELANHEFEMLREITMHPYKTYTASFLPVP